MTNPKPIWTLDPGKHGELLTRAAQDGIDEAIRLYRHAILNGTPAERQAALRAALDAGTTPARTLEVMAELNAAEYARCNADYREESLGDLTADLS